MATRCMTQAVYTGSGEVAPAEYRHYGLAAPLYTHFTSPIRRSARDPWFCNVCALLMPRQLPMLVPCDSGQLITVRLTSPTTCAGMQMWWCTACSLHRWGSSSCLPRCAVLLQLHMAFAAQVLAAGSGLCCWCSAAPSCGSASSYGAGLLHFLLHGLVLAWPTSMLYLQAQDRAALRDLTANLNDRHRNAQFAGRASAELHTLIFFSKQAIAADARIVKVVLRAVTSP